MAKITFIGFVEDWTKNNSQHPAWGLKTAEPHRKKDGEEWVTYSRTYRTVKAAYGVEIDFTQFSKGDRIEVVGTEVTEKREHNDRTYYDIVVKADSVSRVERGDRPAADSVPQREWKEVSESEIPF
ncbi:hypothetical protein NCPPB3778_45 [Rathayibacter phage NCPPB3778]|nr:hypothetical protein NCPPB3778_45 [Rathayibacter phage NCPPB3778]